VLDGLRGLAVAIVVLFHFAPELFPGGFLGVDVFFVLSGFLLTSLVLVEHHNSSRISVRSFFERRVRRLLPAALATITVSVAIAFVIEPDYTRGVLRGDALAAICYLSNWRSISQGTTYASSFGPQSPLAHFWSLAAEEQFYLLFPLMILGMVALLRIVRRRRWPHPQHPRDHGSRRLGSDDDRHPHSRHGSLT
jgi:peptidoglycan/LPS O-acetylase OafA/YrhL